MKAVDRRSFAGEMRRIGSETEVIMHERAARHAVRLILYNKGTSNKNELFVKDLGNRLAPKLDAPVRAVSGTHGGL
jgi:hypothetical protein